MKTGILGYGYYVPERIVTNQDLEKIVETSDEWIVERTGIRERRYASSEESASTMAFEAAQKALTRSGLKVEDIDLILVATVTPDMMFPSTAALLQKALGAHKAAALDLEAACSGFLYGLHLADGLIQSGKHRYILLVGVEVLTRITDFKDRNTCVLFGDGAGAVLLGNTTEGGILASLIGADGSGSEYLYMEAGGSKCPASPETISRGAHYIQMDGSEVFKFAVRKMESASLEVVEAASLSLEDIDYFVPHQANRRIIESAAKRLKIPMERVMVNLEHFGNMSSASIPTALSEAMEEGKIKKGDRVLLVAFGGGLTWSAAVLQMGSHS